ncbi:MAG: gyrase subunit gyrase subunit protein [Candidatus Parcubacteria bacterium]|jgi:DNA gyrase subunit B
MASEEKNKKAGNYSAESIKVLEGLEAVRVRPGMYIGTTGPDGLHHLIWEIFDNSRDEAMGGHCNRIEVALLPGGYIRVVDNGRGIPVGIHPKTKVSALETIMTTLHAGGKFGGEGYKVSGGLHGVGASVVNALSIHTKVVVHTQGGIHEQDYIIGKPKAKVKQIGKTKQHGTIVMFKGDAEIFKDGINFDFQKVVNHLRQQAYLVKGLEINVLDARNVDEKYIDRALNDSTKTFYLKDEGIDMPTMSFFFEGGLRSLVSFYNKSQKPIHRTVFYVEKEVNNVAVEVALQYVDDMNTKLVAFANNTYNSEGGTHIAGFKTALTRTINSYGKKNNILKESDESLTGDDVQEGLVAVVSIKMPEIQFEGQTKAKLGSVEAQGATATAFGEAFSAFLEENPDEAKAIINKGILALRARKAAKAAKDSILRKGALEGMTLPGKLADCSSRKAEESELFIVEGDSAGGTAKMGRDRRTQAVLPLRGKILNIERARLDKMLASEQIRNIVVALGTAIGDTFDITKLRYHKIIIAADADVDGAHIRTLILTLFYRYFRPLVEGGFIYIAQPPLYKIKYKKDLHYFYNDDEKNAFLKKEGLDAQETEEIVEGEENAQEETEESEEEETSAKSKGKSKAHIQRYKGLGEMNAEELGETTMDINNRVLKQVTIEDAVEADKIIDVLMGTDVPARKTFIQTNAKTANIDI